jgi:uncharacterized protein (DUF1501 family)
MSMKRREFLKAGAGLSALTAGLVPGLGSFCPPVLQRRILAGVGAPCDKKLLFIFLRGGMDGINAIIPRGDSSYSTTSRPTLFIPEANGLDLSNGFAQLNPQLARMMDMYTAGDLAVIHRVGYDGQSRSHFDSQQYWENGTLDRDLEVGIFNRLVQNSPALCGEGFAAAGISSGLQVALRGPQPIPNFTDPRDYRFRGTNSDIDKFIGQSPSAGEGRGLLGFYDGAQDFPNKSYRGTIYGAGVVLTETMTVLDGVNPAAYQVSNGAVYPGGQFGTRARIAAQLFKETPVQILGINVGGWDTHTNQTGGYNSRLYDVGTVFQALSLDLQDHWDDLVVMTMTEFGRTSDENGSLGTDHAEAAAMFLAGGGVNGGVYNCDSTTWRNGDMYSTSSGRYLAHRTDFRSIMGEIFRGHFGDSDAVVNAAVPNYDSLASADSLGFTPLGLF